MPFPLPLLRTKLTPAKSGRRLLPRPMLLARLNGAWEHRLTLIHAGAGYGKTSALTLLAETTQAVAWYTVEPEDADPLRFIAYITEACRLAVPHLSDAPMALLRAGEPSPDRAARATDALINALAESITTPLLLLLDDVHTIATSADCIALLERLIHYAPSQLHIVIATRYPLPFAELPRWRVMGALLEVERSALAFHADEISALFATHYGITLTPEETHTLIELTEGWGIALHLIWQRLRLDQRPLQEWMVRRRVDTSLESLFAYLANDVFRHQPPELQEFLAATAILRELTPAACGAVSELPHPEGLLRHIIDLDLFVNAVGDATYRYHPLFHEFLRRHTYDDTVTSQLHRRAAAYFAAIHNEEEAIYHLLAAEEFAAAVTLMESLGDESLRAGRMDTVALWLDALPPDSITTRPRLLALHGDLARLRSRFEDALAWYGQAEQRARATGDVPNLARTLRGQALVYLDTVRPARAEALLEETLRITDGISDREAQVRVMELLAENKLNMGKPHEAEQLRAHARTLRDSGPGEDVLSVRVKLRTGRLTEARRILEQWVERERTAGHAHQPRAHRESVLLLALICAFMGDRAQAQALAEEGIELGKQLDSPFVTVVGFMRLGHALQLTQGAEGYRYRDAVGQYQAAIAQGDDLSVRRTRLEALWGLTRAYGLMGDLAAAQRCATEAVEIGEWAGDSWVVALGELALGASYTLAGRYAEAEPVLVRVLAAFRECGDKFGQAATRLWLALLSRALRQPDHAITQTEALLTLCESEGYDFLLTTPTLLGVTEPRQVVPLLLAVRANPRWQGYVRRLLTGLGLAEVESHPGYQLRVFTLGRFEVWRGNELLEPKAWRRDNARHLFQLLLTERGRWMHREEIMERLWAERTPAAALQDFKVALNALMNALEPNRPAAAPSAFVERDGTAYRLRPTADLYCDADVFEVQVTEGNLIGGLSLYEGDYLPDALYDEWTMPRRDQLRTLFLRAMSRHIEQRLKRLPLSPALLQQCLADCERLWSTDPTWEPAYQLAIRAYRAAGQEAMARKTYQRCADVLREQLGVEPSGETAQLVQ